MVIDDEIATKPLFTQQFKEEIKKGLFDFVFAYSAEEGIDKLGEEVDPAAVLILSDINMPGMSGLQLLKQLKSDHPAMPVMMVTAYGDEANHKKAMAYKADGFINKPIDFAALRDKIMKLIQNRGVPTADLESSPPVTTTKILVVDDEPALEALIRQKFRNKIKAKELEFTFAYNGVQALEIIDQNENMGIVLTDINMPEMDGLTLLAKLKERKRLFRSIVISAYGDMENIRTAMNLGASDFITKPIDLKDLEKTLDKICEQYNCLKAGQRAQHHMIESRKELEIATHIQRAFTPSNFLPFPEKNNLEIFGSIYPAKGICGDFYDFFPIGGRKLGFVIADVSGIGVSAALFMVMSKTLLRSAALTNPSASECIRQVNHYLTYNNESMMFVTAFYGILDVDTGELTYCDAGHQPPYLLSKEGTLKKITKEGGIALGIQDDLQHDQTLYIEKSIQLQKGDSLFLYSDGIIEAVNSETQNYPRESFEKVIAAYGNRPFSEFTAKVKSDIDEFTRGFNLYDDITLLCLRWK